MTPNCHECETKERVIMAPEAGYWYCKGCGSRGSGTDEPIWWENDPNSIWYTGEQE